MKTKTMKSGAIVPLSIFFAVLLVMFCLTAASSPRAFAADNTVVLFSGNSADATVPEENTTVDGIKINFNGISETQAINEGFTVDDVTYHQAIKTGGKSSASRNVAITIPETVSKFVVTVIAAPNVSEAVKFGISTTSYVFANDDIPFLTTDATSHIYVKGTTDVQIVDSSQTYYLTFSSNARIAYIAVTPVTDDSISETNSQDETVTSVEGNAEKDDVLAGNTDILANVNESNIIVKVENGHSILSVIQIVLGVLLVILVGIGVISIVKKNNKKCDFDWCDYDDFDY